MKYYKAEATFTVDGKTFTLTDIKGSNRNYSHAVITVANVQNEFYYNDTTKSNPNFNKVTTLLTFHQGLENAQKASRSGGIVGHATLGGLLTWEKAYDPKRAANPTAQTVIIETVEVDAKTYREFKKSFTNTNYQLPSELAVAI